VTDARAALIARARERHGVVLPCGSRHTLEECFTALPNGELMLWWNDERGDTHILRESEIQGGLHA
jgi:hypothetical protein